MKSAPRINLPLQLSHVPIRFYKFGILVVAFSRRWTPWYRN